MLRRGATTGLERLWTWADTVFTGVLLVGVGSAVAGWVGSAAILAAALGGLLASHLAISLVAYRRVMRRPWPKVAPLADED